MIIILNKNNFVKKLKHYILFKLKKLNGIIFNYFNGLIKKFIKIKLIEMIHSLILQILIELKVKIVWKNKITIPKNNLPLLTKVKKILILWQVHREVLLTINKIKYKVIILYNQKEAKNDMNILWL